jgi:hypothetical protein
MILLNFRVHRAGINDFARRWHDRRWVALRREDGDGSNAHVGLFSLSKGMSGFCFTDNIRVLSTAASRFCLRLGTGGRGQKFLPTLVAAKVERLSIAFGVESGGFVHGHSADGVFGHGFRFIHGHVSFLVNVVTIF